MPRVNLYVRNEDREKWDAIKNKAKWLHAALNTSIVEMAINQDKDPGQPSITYKGETIIGSMNVSAIERILELESANNDFTNILYKGEELTRMTQPEDGAFDNVLQRRIFKQDNDLCEHYQPKGQCLVKGCKYGK